MQHIKYFVHGVSPYIIPHYMALSDLPSVLRDCEKAAMESLKASGDAHAVYAVKKYTVDGEIEKVDFYSPPVCLNDSEFDKRTDAVVKEYRDCLIYAVHAR